ncbi:MAG: hypothetical protein IJO93_06990, partial [Clostridia bacterium]|nr:hypothetical protein [Clostridia bacterium]
MFGKKTEYIHMGAKASDEQITALAAELAMYGIRRSKKNKMPRNFTAGILRELSTDYKQMAAATRAKIIMPETVHTIMENHYIVDKAQSNQSDTGRELFRKKHVVFENGRYKGAIRIYVICETLLECKNFSLDYNSLKLFLDAFQEISPLDEGEIALIPQMLSLVCVERAASLYGEACALLREYVKAKRIYDRIHMSQSTKRTEIMLDEAARELGSAGRTRLYMLLSEKDEFSHIEMFNHALTKLSTGISDESANDRSWQIALSELAVNITGALRFISGLGGEKLQEDFSVLHRILNEDTVYRQMDNPSKNAYAAACDKIAGKLRISQSAVAREARRLSGNEHIGYYLLDENGISFLMDALGGRIYHKSKRCKLCCIITAQVALTLLFAAFCALGCPMCGLIAIAPAFVLAEAIIVRAYCSMQPPTPVPRMKIENVSPEKTAVAVSILLTDEKSLTGAMERLETHYMSGALSGVYYVILSDFPDSKTPETTEEECGLLALAEKLTHDLNKKYAKDEDVFFFLHRKRTKNAKDALYMGHERKRGAIMQFFSLLEGHDNRAREAYEFISGNLPQDIKYALLLDSDTVMLKDSLAQMIGAATHPLAKAVVKNGVVEKGYGIFVPRMERIAGASTEFMRLHNSSSGTSPYSTLVCDFYFDNFSEAIFGGKGLVDISAFCECIRGRIDDNTVLSHDMLESIFVKTAYLSDIVLYDSEPAKFFSWWKREHRWIRGDWQLLPYLFARKGSKKHVSPVSKHKIVSNLLRSLRPVFITSALWYIPFFGFSLYAWVAIFAAFSDCIVSSVYALSGLFHRRPVPWRELAQQWGMSFIDFPALPYAAARVYDAVIRTLYRLIFSHKNMLQWQTAAQSENSKKQGVLSYYIKMWQCIVLGLHLLILPLFGFSGSLILGIVFLYAPFAAYLCDIPYREEELSSGAREYYMSLCREIWDFFQTESPKEMGYIPPDNVQVYPYMPAVYNASPTNIGMGIMACACAYDLGFITQDMLIERLCVTQDTLDSLEKWNGHLYNWYDMNTKKRLEPAYVSTVDSGNLCACLLYAAQLLRETGDARAEKCALGMEKTVYDMDFSALFDKDKNLFYIGYDVTSCALTRAWYDLLASEARLTYLVACGLGKIPQKAWGSLGRLLTGSRDMRVLVSWSGTMFEYLMPVIFTGKTPYTLMDETCKAAVGIQIKCADGKPFGISESGYYAFDRNMYYQYRAFGALPLGLAPMKAHEDVRAPYASALSAMVYPEKAFENLKAFERVGARGKYGFFEAVDYTYGRVQKGHECEVVRSYMAHHQGMSICSLTNVLCKDIISNRFSHIPQMRSVMPYNDEKLPDSSLTLREYERMILHDDEAVRKSFSPPEYKSAGRYPRGSFLTNGRLTAYMTDSGVSHLKFHDAYITSFRRDYIRGKQGLFLYLRCGDKIYCINTNDPDSDACSQSFIFEGCKTGVNTAAEDFSVNCVSCVMQNEDALCMKVTVANHSDSVKNFEAGAFARMSMATLQEDIAHPAFVRLTVDSYEKDGTLFFRRKGDRKRKELYAFSRFFGITNVKCASDGYEIVGRHGTYRGAMQNVMSANGRIKSPVEPMMCIRGDLSVGAGESAEFTFIFGAAHDENAQTLHMTSRGDAPDFSQQTSLAFAMEMSAIRFMGISDGKAQLLTSILSVLCLGIKKKSEQITGSTLPFSQMYKFSVSGELPILLVEIHSPMQFRLLKTLLSLVKFSEYKGEPFDLIIIGRYAMSYRCDVKDYITDTLGTFMMSASTSESRRIHFIDGFDITDDEYRLLIQSADIVIAPTRTLGAQFADEPLPKSIHFPGNAQKSPVRKFCKGDFLPNGEYVIKLKSDEDTPLPWSNVICNPENEAMGTLVTESGGGYTWYGNCHNTRLSQWYCDPIFDTQGEILLISDEAGHMRTVSHGKIQGNGTVTVRHGFGYSIFENYGDICDMRMTVLCDTDTPQKITLLELMNNSDKDKKLTVRYMVDRHDLQSAYTEFSDSVAYMYGSKLTSPIYMTVKNADSIRFSGDREAELLFFEKKRNVNNEGFISLTCDVYLHARENRNLILLFGMGQREKARETAGRESVGSVNEKLARIKTAWDDKLHGITVKTPEINFDRMVNGRLLYQVYASRLMGRTGFYQSGGAIGFRDQLQDVLSLLYTDSERAKGQILLCASMQYEDGDVMHWWHTPNKGVRTRITD